MGKRTGLRIPALLTALLLPAVACDTGANEQDLSTMDDTAGVAVEPGQERPGIGETATADAEFGSFLVTANTLEIQAAELAQQQATNPQVQEFAQQMITDHRQASDQVNQALQATGTEGMGSAAQSLREDAEENQRELQGLTGAEFDRRYIEQQIEMHERVLDELDSATSPAAQQLAQSLRPTLQQHLDRARQIQEQLGAG